MLSKPSKLTIAILLAFSFVQNACSQAKVTQTLNLDFEQHRNGFPSQWTTFGDKEYKFYVDSVHKKSGKFSAVVENTGSKKNYGALSITLPANYEGKSIRLSGFIKTENVTEGYAGLWIRIDPQIGFDNMSNRGVTGTTDWAPFEINLPLNPKETKQIVIGGLLVGKGKMWLDDLKITIDGTELGDPKIKTFQKEIFAAQADKAFDDGSKVTFPTLNQDLIHNLELLGKVWGLMKYHHPEIAKGKYNWDYELFRFLPDYIKVKDKQQRDNLLANWIKNYGVLSACKTCKATPSDAVLKPDLSWINDAGLSANLKSQLTDLYNNRNQGKNYYIALEPGVRNPNFSNERPYLEMTNPDAGFRLLSLYRYWNMINYFFPYRHLTDKKWDTVLEEYIPKFLNAQDKLAYELTAAQLIGEVNDTHANLWGGREKSNALRGTKFAAFKAEFVENQLVVVDYFNPEFSGLAKVKIGDVITHVNGKTINSLVDSLKPYYPASNSAARFRDMSIDLLRSPNNTIALNYLSEGQKRQVNVPTYERKDLRMYHWYKVDSSQKCYKLLPGNIGYITLANIKQEDIPEIKKAFKETKGIIIDIRNYPNTFVPFSLGSYFVTKPTSFVKFTTGNPDNPGEFVFLEGPKITSDNNKYKGKLVVLVNENSQSQAEYTAMAFHSVKNSTIVGSTTAGADGNVSSIFLPGGLRTMISGIGVYYPNGKETQRVGIVPEIVVKPTIKGILNGKDEVLERAIKVISQ
ncbi:peptidase S41 [Pedobacter sp. MR2016-19]|uniref:S41 family peptidase n=1 Tax=Pedobacter sp. MR2016-19 TaxID=2780089 RepID=UPI001875D03B|nr:S41 family peptidase [Pedobacter sp. MR2016-19]MBE5318724.1 peptidase S41 [Pedobacter sp. MR2016-19]